MPTVVLRKKRGHAYSSTQEKARLLESNRASGTAHGGRKNYLRERPFEPELFPLPRALDPPLGRELAPRRVEAFLAALPRLAFGALFLALFFPAAFRPPAPDLALLAPDFCPAAFPVPEDLEALFAAFLGVPPPLVGRGAGAELLPAATPPPLRALGGEPPRPLRAAPPAPAALDPLDAPPEGALPNAPLPDPAAPPSPPPARDDSCRFPDPLGRPLLPLGAPPPKRSSSSSSSSASSPSLTTVASESTSSSSSASSALSHRRSL